MFASVCNPVWQVKELLMQNPQTYLLGFFAWNHPQRSHPPFLECVLMKTLFSCSPLKPGLFRAAYWGKSTMDFIYCLCGSYRNSEPDWNRASGVEEWRAITKGCWKSWAHCRADSWSGLGRLTPVTAQCHCSTHKNKQSPTKWTLAGI